MWELLSEKMYHSSVHIKDLYINRKKKEQKNDKEEKESLFKIAYMMENCE